VVVAVELDGVFRFLLIAANDEVEVRSERVAPYFAQDAEPVEGEDIGDAHLGID
jgi:hypothetical protein